MGAEAEGLDPSAPPTPKREQAAALQSGLHRRGQLVQRVIMLRLRSATPDAWIETVVANLDSFLQDHAANERKVSASGFSGQHDARRVDVICLCLIIDVAKSA